MTSFHHPLPFGAEIVDGGVRFRLWAPSVETVALVLEDGPKLPMERRDGGWFELTTPAAGPGSRYRFRLPDGLQVPDPASRHQLGDVHGPSEVWDPKRYQWRHAGWKGRPWAETVFYELHVGTFTEEGTYDALRRKFDHLVDLGVTAIELMPLAECPGARNWGYDGVLPFAPEAAYGNPDDLKALIDEAHGRGLMVFLDVVYNHFGPEGNYLGAYARSFFTDRHETPWGAAINFDGADSRPVRDYFINNAIYWLNEYRFDGLRFDAVHAIVDDSDLHVLDELSARVRESVEPGRHVHLVLENGDNDSHFLKRHGNMPGTYTGQWNDDYHHAAHVVLSREEEGYYHAFAGEPTRNLARTLAHGFIFEGHATGEGRELDDKANADVPPAAFVQFLQNHDQIGNRAFGDRLAALAPHEALRALTAVTLLAPQPPMLFMGEEWATRRPFLFFCDFDEPLATAVREGRRREFGHFKAFADPQARERIPDPTDAATFRASTLDWSEAATGDHADWLAFTRSLLDTRRRRIVPLLDRLREPGTYRLYGDAAFRVDWRLETGALLRLIANVGNEASKIDEAPLADTIYESHPASGSDGRRPGWSVSWSASPA